MEVFIKRAYEPADKADGFRILVDRLWPRGLKKEEAHLDQWIKEIAPSVKLRKWFDHDPEKWLVFNKEYHTELKNNKALPALIDYIKAHKTVTLIYSAHDEKHNNALILQDFIHEIKG